MCSLRDQMIEITYFSNNFLSEFYNNNTLYIMITKNMIFETVFILIKMTQTIFFYTKNGINPNYNYMIFISFKK